MWEESMAKVAREQEELEQKIGESEDKRKRTKRALKDALENLAVVESQPATPGLDAQQYEEAKEEAEEDFTSRGLSSPNRRRSTFVDLSGVSEDDSEGEEEFFDAVGSGEVEVVEMPPTSPGLKAEDVPASTGDLRVQKIKAIEPSFKGYEDSIRKKLKMDADDRPKISLWVGLSFILPSIIETCANVLTLVLGYFEVYDRKGHD
jgi:hypothetical protein